jgi:ATP phosphoribosyltransferase
MLRIAVQSKGRLFDDTMNLLSELVTENVDACAAVHMATPATAKMVRSCGIFMLMLL